MSAIAGYLGNTGETETLNAMMGKLTHRGTFSGATYAHDGVFMGGCGFDPVTNAEETLAIVFSGHIYNAGELRRELAEKEIIIRDPSDGALLLQLYALDGFDMLRRLRGAFAFAIHDAQKNLVFMARDHLGVEPFYYTTTQWGTFVFASEIKALLKHPGVSVVPDMVGIDAYLSLGYSPGTHGMFKGIHSLPAGHRAIWNAGLHTLIEPYWRRTDFNKPDPSLKSDGDFQARFDQLFEESLRMRMGGDDQPIGAFLSGDFSSAAMVAAMAKNAGGRQVQSFMTVVEGEAWPLMLSDMDNCRMRKMAMVPADMEILPELIWSLNEPVGNPDVLMTHLLSRFAGQHVSTVLSAKGGADILGGGGIHETMTEGQRISKPFHALLKPFVRNAPLHLLEKSFSGFGKMGERGRQKLIDYVDALRRGSVPDQYAALTRVFEARDKLGLYGTDIFSILDTFSDLHVPDVRGMSLLQAILEMQNAQGLPDHLLSRLESVASLDNIDARVPFLDAALVEFMQSVPDHLKYKDGKGLILLRNYTARIAPQLSTLPQRTGAFPLHHHMSSRPLRDMMDACLSETSVRKRGLFEWSGLRVMLEKFKTGEHLYARQLFAMLTLELWFRVFVDKERGWISGT